MTSSLCIVKQFFGQMEIEDIRYCPWKGSGVYSSRFRDNQIWVCWLNKARHLFGNEFGQELGTIITQGDRYRCNGPIKDVLKSIKQGVWESI